MQSAAEEKTYNGWSNYETWNVALWIDNEEGSYNMAREMAQDAWDNAKGDDAVEREDAAEISLADSLKDWVEEMNPLSGEASMFTDLLNAALSEVDWYEIAKHYLSDVEKEDEDEEENEEITSE